MPFTDKTIADIYYELFAAHGVARVMRHQKWIDAIIEKKRAMSEGRYDAIPKTIQTHTLP